MYIIVLYIRWYCIVIYIIISIEGIKLIVSTMQSQYSQRPAEMAENMFKKRIIFDIANNCYFFYIRKIRKGIIN